MFEPLMVDPKQVRQWCNTQWMEYAALTVPSGRLQYEVQVGKPYVRVRLNGNILVETLAEEAAEVFNRVLREES